MRKRITRVMFATLRAMILLIGSVSRPLFRQVRRAGLTFARPKRMLASASVIMVGIAVAICLSGGTFAIQNSQKSFGSSTVSSGNTSVTLQASGTTAGTVTTIPAAAWSNMLPGDIVGQQVQLTNTGTSAVSLSFSLAAALAWDIRVAWGTCPTTQITNGALTTTPAFGATVAAGYSNTMCVQATLPTSAPAGAAGTSPALSLLVSVTQATP